MKQENIYNLQIGDKVIYTNKHDYISTFLITRITDKSIFCGRFRNSINHINTLIKKGAEILRKDADLKTPQQRKLFKIQSNIQF